MVCNLKPLVSVIIPMYNSEKYIEDAVLSVINQEIFCEIIIVDDFSKDNSLTRVYQIIEKNLTKCKFKIIRNNENKGVSECRNIAINNSEGKYIAFLDSDDIWIENKLKKQISKLEKDKEAIICSTAFEYIMENGEKTGCVIKGKNKIKYNDMLFHNLIACSSVIIKRDIIIKYGMEKSTYHEDYITWMKILKNGNYAININESLLLYRRRRNSKTANKLKSAIMHYNSLKYINIKKPVIMFYFSYYAFNGLKRLICYKFKNILYKLKTSQGVN